MSGGGGGGGGGVVVMVVWVVVVVVMVVEWWWGGDGDGGVVSEHDTYVALRLSAHCHSKRVQGSPPSHPRFLSAKDHTEVAPVFPSSLTIIVR